MKFKVDENACIGCGACCSICEEVFEFSSEGFAVAKDEKITDKEIENYYKNDAIGDMEINHILITADVKDGAKNDEKKAAEEAQQ